MYELVTCYHSVKFGFQLDEVWLPHTVTRIIGCTPSPILSELTCRSYNRDPKYCLLSKNGVSPKRTHKKFLYSTSLGIPPSCGVHRGPIHTKNNTWPTFLHAFCWCVNWSHVTESLKFECHFNKTFLAGLTYGGIQSLSMVSSSYRYGGVSGGSSCSSSLLE